MSFPTTRPTLLSRMRKGDNDAWIEFFQKYTVSVLAFFRRRDLGKQDAEDLWQEVLLKMSQETLHMYRSDRGGFRAWLLGALQQQLANWHRRINARKRGRSVTVSGDEPKSLEDSEGATRFDELEDESQRHYAKNRHAVQEELEQVLHGFDHDEKRAYLDSFWNDDDLTYEEIARRHGLKLHKLRYVREKAEASLYQRWEKELQLGF